MNRPLLLLLLGIALSSCAGWKKNLVKMDVEVPGELELRPGSSFPLTVKLLDGKGKRRSAGNTPSDKVKWKNFRITVSGGSWDPKKGTVLIDSNADNIAHHTVSLICEWKPDKRFTDHVDVLLNYRGKTAFSFNGKSGEKGDDKGSRVVPIKIGGTGLSSGKDGEDGGNGDPGQDVEVYIRPVKDTAYRHLTGETLYEGVAHSKSLGITRRFYLSRDQSILQISCTGGNGGNGGNGGPGTDGRDASGMRGAGSGTDGGDGGNGGNGGNGGSIAVYLLPGAEIFEGRIELLNSGGMGGQGGLGGSGGRGGRKINGSYEPSGNAGSNGRNGINGDPGPEIRILKGNFDTPE